MGTNQKEGATFEEILEELKRQTGDIPAAEDKPADKAPPQEPPKITYQEEAPPPPQKEKLEEFLNASTQNIYSSTKQKSKPLLFGTATIHSFEQEFQQDKNQATRMSEPVIDAKTLRQYQKFKQQRVEKASDFNLEHEDEPPLITEPEEFDNEQEFNRPEDAARIEGDLIALKKSLRRRGLILSGISLVSVYIAAAAQFALPVPALFSIDSPVSYLITNLVLLLGAMGTVFSTVIFGLKGMLKLKMNRDSLPVVTALLCTLQLVLMLITKGNGLAAGGNAFVLAPIAIVGLTCNSFFKSIIASRTVKNFKFISSEKYEQYSSGVMANEDLAEVFTRGTVSHRPVVSFNRKAGFLTDFMYYSFLEDITDKFSFYLVPVGIGVSLILSFISGFMAGSFAVGLTAFTAGICIASPFSYLLAANLPLQRAANKLSKVSAVLLSYEAVEEFSNLNAALTTAHDLFPAGTVSMRGMKTFAGARIDDAILDAASVFEASNSILRDAFMQVILGETKILKKVDSVVFEDMMGVSAWVDERKVLIGSREMMIRHNVEVPTEAEERFYRPDGLDIIYVANSGILTAAFMFTMQADLKVRDALDDLVSNGIYLVVQTVDPVVTKKRLSDTFAIDEEAFKILPARFHESYNKQAGEVERASGLVANNGKFYSYIEAVVTAKRLKPLVLFSMTLVFASIVLGMMLLCVLGAVDGLSEFGVITMLLYELAWTAAVAVLPLLRRV